MPSEAAETSAGLAQDSAEQGVRARSLIEQAGHNLRSVRVIVETPTDLTSDQEALLREVAELRGEDVAPADEGWLKRIRSAFS